MEWLKNLLGGPAPPSFPPSDSSPELATTLIVVEQMTCELEDYLLGEQLFRQIIVETPLGPQRPKMTLGGLYQRMEELAKADLGPKDSKRLRAAENDWAAARARFPDLFTAKLQREMVSYLNNWKYFLDQRGRDLQRWREDFKVEQRNRQRVMLIIRLLGSDAPHELVTDLADMEKDIDMSDFADTQS